LLDGTIDDETYRQRRAQLDFDLISARDELHDRQLEEFDLKGVLNLAEYALTNAARLWLEFAPPHRVRFQKALFPHGLPYSKLEKFGTAANTYPVRVLREFSADASRMAPHTHHGSNTLLLWLKRVHLFSMSL